MVRNEEEREEEPNAETRQALAEYEDMKKHLEKYKSYHSIEESLDELEQEP